MKIYEPSGRTSADTIRRHWQFADREADPKAVAQEWTEAGFSDDLTARWLAACCFDAQAARALTELGVTPEQAGARTRDGGDGAIETIAYKVADGDLTPRQGAARCLSSR